MGGTNPLEYRIDGILNTPTTRRVFLKTAPPAIASIYTACTDNPTDNPTAPPQIQIADPFLQLKANGADSATLIGEGTVPLSVKATPGYKEASISEVVLRDGSWERRTLPVDTVESALYKNDTDSDMTHTVEGTALQSDKRTAVQRVSIIVKPYEKIAGTVYTIKFSDGKYTIVPLQNTTLQETGRQIEAGGANAIIGGDGRYLLKASRTIEEMVGSAPGHQKYTTFLRHYADRLNQRILLFPTEYIEIFNDYVRRGQGPPNGTGPDKGLRHADTSLNWKAVIFAGNYGEISPPGGGKYPLQFSQSRIQTILDVLKKDPAKYTDGKIPNFTDAQIEFTDGTPPPDTPDAYEIGKVLIQPTAGGSGGSGYPLDGFLSKGGRMFLNPIDSGLLVDRHTGSHELNHVLFANGHPKAGVDSTMAWGPGLAYPTSLDELMGVIVFNGWRPRGSLPFDNDPK